MKALGLVFFVISLSAVTQVTYAHFQDNSDGTVTDLNTQLMWQRCSAPSEETNCGGVSPALYAWEDALTYCNDLALSGYSDWRLPNIKELHSIVDVTKNTEPTIDTTFFPDTQAVNYWTSTTAAGTTDFAWYVAFSIGYVMTSVVTKGEWLSARCVRGE